MVQNTSPNTANVSAVKMDPHSSDELSLLLERRTRECETARKLVEAMKSYRDSDKKIISDLEANLASIKAELTRITQERDALVSATQASSLLSHDADKAKASEVKSLEAEIAALKDERGRLEKGLAESVLAVDLIKQEKEAALRNMTDDINGLKSQVSQFKGERERLLKDKEELSLITVKYDRVCREKESLAGALSSTRVELDRMKQVTESGTSQLKVELDASRACCEIIQKEKEAMAAAFMGEKEAFKCEISLLKKELADLQAVKDTLTKERDNWESTAKASIDKLTNACEQRDRLKSEVTILTEEVASLKAKNSNDEAELKKEKESLRYESDTKIRVALSAQREAEDKLAQMENAVAALKKGERCMQDEIDALVQSQSQAIEKIALTGKAKEYAEKQAREAEEKAKVAQQKLQSTDKALRDAELKIAQFKEQLSVQERLVKDFETRANATSVRLLDLEEASKRRVPIVAMFTAILMFILMRIMG